MDGFFKLNGYCILVFMVISLILLSACSSLKPISRNKASSESTYSFLAMSDIHYSNTGAEEYCDVCETTDALWKVTKVKAIDLINNQQPDFVILTGDLPGHRSWHKTDPSTRREITETVAEEFHTSLGGLSEIVKDAQIPVIVVPGNNDSLAGDYCSFTANVSDKRFNGKTPFDEAPNPANWLANNGASIANNANLAKGYYSIYPYGAPAGGGALRIIVLNTVVFTQNYSDNYCNDDYQSDANAQLEWLSDELSDARQKQDKVLITMHVPPGIEGYKDKKHKDVRVTMWNEHLKYTGMKLSDDSGKWVQAVFLDMVGKYTAETVGILSGHTHFNGIRRIHNCSGDFVELDISIPGITTDHGNRPGMKMIHANDQFELTTSQTYYADVHKGISYDWNANNVFSFAKNYKCDTCTGDTMFERIRNMSKMSEGRKDVLDGMLKYLELTPKHPTEEQYYGTAINATCSAQTP